MKHHTTPLFEHGESEVHENTHISKTNVSYTQPSSPQENSNNNNSNVTNNENNNNVINDGNNENNTMNNENNDVQSTMTNRLTESQFSCSTLYETLINSPLSPPLTTNTNTNTTTTTAIVVATMMTGKSIETDSQQVNHKEEETEANEKNEISRKDGANQGNVISKEIITVRERKEECLQGQEQDLPERRSERENEQKEKQEQQSSQKTSKATDMVKFEESNDECEEQLYSFLYKRENVERDQLMCISYKLLQLFLHTRIGEAEMCNYSVLPLSENSGLVEKVDGYALSRLPGIAHNVDIATFIKQRGKNAYTNFYASAKLFLLLSYIFSIGDRHQGNVMISSMGAILHIDFGLIFSEKTFVEKLAGTTLRVDNQFLTAIAACRQYMTEQDETAQDTQNQTENKCNQKSCKTEKCKVLISETTKEQNEEVCKCNTSSAIDKANEVADENKSDEFRKKVVNIAINNDSKMNIDNNNSLQSNEVKNGSLQLSSSALLGAITQRCCADYETFFDEAAE